MSDDEKMPVGYEAGMIQAGACGGLNTPNHGAWADQRLRVPVGLGTGPLTAESIYVGHARGISEQAQNMTNHAILGGQFAPNTPKVAAPLDEALAGFVAERDALAKVVAALTERLKPVLRPVEPAKGAGGGGQAGVPPVSPVVAALRSECAAFAAQRCVLSTLLSRLDL